ncbi:MAG TPA: hypothetical protein VM912_13390 [Terriglobales bacterium]|nr:hypothetical protein [Terriglobales bacterium]
MAVPFLRMLAIEIIFAILFVIAAVVLLLDKTTPSGEACFTAIKATVFAILALPIAIWLFTSTVIRRAKRRFSGAHASFQR